MVKRRDFELVVLKDSKWLHGNPPCATALPLLYPYVYHHDTLLLQTKTMIGWLKPNLPAKALFSNCDWRTSEVQIHSCVDNPIHQARIYGIMLLLWRIVSRAR